MEPAARSSPTATVVLSTYNQPAWLELALDGYALQSERDFELIVADDGSGRETAAVVDAFRRRSGLPVLHQWQEDRGFRKCRALNRAIAASRGEYLIFSDGDCVPPPDFVATHLWHARSGRFLSGSYYKLAASVSARIARSGPDPEPPSIRNLLALGCAPGLALLKAAALPPVLEWALDRVAAIKRITWNGHNSSAWKRDLVRVNGFDERMGYWGEDRELGLRLRHAGVRPLQLRHRCCCLHLHHERPYRDPALQTRNRELLREVVSHRRSWTLHGLAPGPPRPQIPIPHPVGAKDFRPAGISQS